MSVEAAAARTLSAEDRRFLLSLARAAIRARLEGSEPPATARPSLASRRDGAFVSLHRRSDGDLRGCVGLLDPDQPLPETVAQAAVSAAVSDGRFDPVEASELSGLAIEISVLGPLRPARPDEVEVGTHGLLVRCEGRRGLLLPQVAVEHAWDRETFLDKTCGKAGLPPRTWQRPDAEVLAFTAEVFGEEEGRPDQQGG